MKSIVRYLTLLLSPLFGSALVHAQNATAVGSVNGGVGIGTTTPTAYFNVAEGKDVLFGQNSSGVGSMLIWYATKGAFRAGAIFASVPATPVSVWDVSRVSLFSFASGVNTLASNDNTTAMGYASVASGSNATAMGTNSTASGNFSTALGYRVEASGNGSTAIGYNVSTNGKTGSIIIGDGSNNLYVSDNDQKMTMRFGGGYALYSAGGPQNTSLGVELRPNQSAWSVVSDSTKKENYRYVDGAGVLQKINQMRLGSWNYRGQDPTAYRHYGPMAQDFFTAFGHDAIGTIGESTRINQADFDGINLIAIKALIAEVNQLKAENKQLKTALDETRQQDKVTQSRLATIETMLNGASGTAALTQKP